MAEYHVLRADEVPLPYSTYDRIRDEIISKLTLEDDTRTEAQTQALITLTTSVTATSLQDIIAVLRDGGFTYTDVNDVFRDLSKDNKDIVDPEFISIVENATGPDDFSSLALYSAYWTNNNLGGYVGANDGDEDLLKANVVSAQSALDAIYYLDAFDPETGEIKDSELLVGLLTHQTTLASLTRAQLDAVFNAVVQGDGIAVTVTEQEVLDALVAESLLTDDQTSLLQAGIDGPALLEALRDGDVDAAKTLIRGLDAQTISTVLQSEPDLIEAFFEVSPLTSSVVSKPNAVLADVVSDVFVPGAPLDFAMANMFLSMTKPSRDGYNPVSALGDTEKNLLAQVFASQSVDSIRDALGATEAPELTFLQLLGETRVQKALGETLGGALQMNDWARVALIVEQVDGVASDDFKGIEGAQISAIVNAALALDPGTVDIEDSYDVVTSLWKDQSRVAMMQEMDLLEIIASPSYVGSLSEDDRGALMAIALDKCADSQVLAAIAAYPESDLKTGLAVSLAQYALDEHSSGSLPNFILALYQNDENHAALDAVLALDVGDNTVLRTLLESYSEGLDDLLDATALDSELSNTEKAAIVSQQLQILQDPRYIAARENAETAYNVLDIGGDETVTLGSIFNEYVLDMLSHEDGITGVDRLMDDEGIVSLGESSVQAPTDTPNVAAKSDKGGPELI